MNINRGGVGRNVGSGELGGEGEPQPLTDVDLRPVDGVHHTSVPIRAGHKLRP